jgi:putative FmdB family regulatory protein
MPTYVYRCLNCDERLEAFQKMTDDPLTTCEECGGSLRRVLQPVGIVFKGAGFYTTDYKRAESSNGKSAPAENGKSDSSSVKTEAAPSESAAPKATEAKKETTAAAP